MMRTTVREADRLLPVQHAMRWMLVESSAPLLLTGDTPVVTISGTGEVTHRPLLLPDLHEIHLPVTAERLLTLSPFPSLAPAAAATTALTTEQAGLVNRAIIRACAASVFRHPDMPWPADLALPRRRAPLHAPTVNVPRGTGKPAARQGFPAITDETLQGALDLLGGDPDLDWP